MSQKIELKHPAGKKAISMDKEKYDVISKAVLNFLKSTEEATHSEILSAITNDFYTAKTPFKGSVEWHMEWVKLHLEATEKIIRLSGSTPVKYKLN